MLASANPQKDITHAAIALYAATSADTDFTALTADQIRELIDHGMATLGGPQIHAMAQSWITTNLHLLNGAIPPREYRRRLHDLWPDDDRLQHCNTAAFRYLNAAHKH